MQHTKSAELTVPFNKYYPGSHTNFKVPLEPTPYRLFCAKSEGCRVWDVDGNEYVEYNGAMGPTYIGHRHPHLVESLHKYLDTMNPQLGTGVCVTEYDITLAEKFIKHVPCCDALHLNLSGTDAVQLVIRLARAYTGKSLFVRFGGSYHGWADNVLGGRLQTDPNKKPFAYFTEGQTIADDITYSEGISKGAFQDSLLIPTNDFEALETTFAKYGDEIALVHMEPIMNNHWGFRQKPGFIEKVRELCDKHGALMSFDEVICGFRHAIGGAQEYLGITPDLASYGKAMAGGIPVSAVAGRQDIMDLIGDFRVLAPGTANGWPMGNCATVATIEILEADNGAVYKHVAKMQKMLEDGLTELGKKHGEPLKIQSAPGVFFLIFGVEEEGDLYTDDQLATMNYDKVVKFHKGLHDNGVLVLFGGRWYMNIAHDEKAIEQTLAAADKAMDTL